MISFRRTEFGHRVVWASQRLPAIERVPVGVVSFKRDQVNPTVVEELAHTGLSGEDGVDALAGDVDKDG